MAAHGACNKPKYAGLEGWGSVGMVSSDGIFRNYVPGHDSVRKDPVSSEPTCSSCLAFQYDAKIKYNPDLLP